MKKPNITPGEWVLNRHDKTVRIKIHKGYYYSAYGGTIENAKAISAVPNLLDEAYSTYLMLISHPQYVVENDQEFIDRVDGLKEALTKAGCEL